MVKQYIPDRGHLIWLTFDPQAGREQAGHRPAIVLTADYYNKASGLALVCPITSRVKKYPFEVPVKQGKIKGVILTDQIKSLDWKLRGASFADRASDAVVCAVMESITTLLTE